jgi:hypothetical protein
VRQVPGFAAGAGSPSNRVTDARIGRGVPVSRWIIAGAVLVIFDVVATRTCPLPGLSTSMARWAASARTQARR